MYMIKGIRVRKYLKIFCQSAENFQYAFHFSLSKAFYIIVYYLGLYIVVYASLSMLFIYSLIGLTILLY
uniref:Uncharacterized protein n=1 Tax=Podoviridae sp. ctwV53 TaxID=2826587 RepID=A0A8S5MS53_9CAUD|nr:MAG TPA: hypothetical protein [Podoviridae sp. ctwV53]